MRYWLFKSEPSTFSIDDLEQKPSQSAPWDGVRNYQVRNFLRDTIQPGDLAFFYHSSCPVPGIVGIMEIISPGYPDETSWNPKSPGFDPKSSKENPRWWLVDVRLKEKFTNLISLEELKKQSNLRQMLICRKGNRLSITPVTKEEWKAVLELKKI